MQVSGGVSKVVEDGRAIKRTTNGLRNLGSTPDTVYRLFEFVLYLAPSEG